MTETPHPDQDAEKRAIRFLIIKVGLFLLIPPIAAGIALWIVF